MTNTDILSDINKSDDKWVSTETGSHLLLDGDGMVIGGAGGKLNGKSKKTETKTNRSGWSKNSYGVEVNNTDGHKQTLVKSLEGIKTGEKVSIKHSDGREIKGTLEGYDKTDQNDGSRNIKIKLDDGRIKGFASFVVEGVNKDDSSEKADSYADEIPSNNPNRPIDAEAIESTDDLAIAEKMATGEITGIIATDKCLLVPMRITGTGITERDNNGTKYNIDRPAETFLTDRFLQQCAGLPVAFLHPSDGNGGYTSVNYDNWKDYIVGSIFYPFIKETEVWGVAKIFDLSMLDAFNEGILSTSPFVTSQNIADANGDLTERLEDINHVAIVKAGHWDTDAPAIIANNEIQFKEDLMAEDKKPVEDDTKVDAAGNMANIDPKAEVKPDAEPVAPVVAPVETPAEEKGESAELAALKAQVEKLAAVITTLVASDKAVHAEIPEEAEDEDSDKKAEMVNAISEMADSAHSGVKVIKPVDSKNLSSADYVRRTIKFNKELIDPKYHFLADKVDSALVSIAQDAIANLKSNVEKKSAELYSSASKNKAGTYTPTRNGMEVDRNF